GSAIQIIGTDNIDSIRGPNPVGCVFSEYAFQDPRAWDIVRPILRENKGWALFAYTPNGKNHGYRLYNVARVEMDQGNPEWFCQLLTVRETFRPDETPVIAEREIEEERRTGMDEDLIQQEYYCSFAGGVHGSYYSKLLERIQDEGRIGTVPYNPALPVLTFWDIGIADSTAIWFVQVVGNEYHVIDYYQNSGEGLLFYWRELQARPYQYAPYHYGPHDLVARDAGTGKSRVEIARTFGLRFRIVPKLSVDDGIDAVRRTLVRCRFDKEKCQRGLDALYNYHKTWDEGRKEFSRTPQHDWSSDGADAFRYFAVGIRAPDAPGSRQSFADSSFSPFDDSHQVPTQEWAESEFEVLN
ncbi:MAG: hypothetical protein ACREDF_09155, partial [Thermoplasmata archaeon]